MGALTGHRQRTNQGIDMRERGGREEGERRESGRREGDEGGGTVRNDTGDRDSETYREL